MNRLSRKDYKVRARRDKGFSSKRSKSTCGAHRLQHSQRNKTNHRKDNDKNLQNNKRSRSALPVQGKRRSMSQRQVQAGHRNNCVARNNGYRTESRKHSSFELKTFLEESYNYMQDLNKDETDVPKESAFHLQDTKMPVNVFPPGKPFIKRNSGQADDIHCQPAKQQTSGCQTVKQTQHCKIVMRIPEVCAKSVDHELVEDEIRSELIAKKKTKKGLFPNINRAFLACFGIKKR